MVEPAGLFDAFQCLELPKFLADLGPSCPQKEIAIGSLNLGPSLEVLVIITGGDKSLVKLHIIN